MWSRASQCPVSHLGMGVRILVFAPYLCNTSDSGLDEYVDGCLFGKEADWQQIGTLFVWVEALERVGRGWVVGQGGPPNKQDMTSINFFWRLLPVMSK